MKQSRFTDEQIIGFLKQAEAGLRQVGKQLRIKNHDGLNARLVNYYNSYHQHS